MAPNDKVSYQHSLKVTSHHLDHLNHVNNAVYLDWVQEVAYLHWNLLATQEIKDASIWMVLRHEIDYLRQAYLNDEITIHTWIEDSAGVKSTRMVHMYRGDELLTKSKTTFCLLDKNTQKPKRISQEILTLFTK